MATTAHAAFTRLQSEIRACTLCAKHLPLGPRPVLQAHPAAKILIVGQAPGTAVHRTGIPFNDPSGDRLRAWLGVDKDVFYDAEKIALVPMGFCYPGKGKGGDLPPRPEYAARWREPTARPLNSGAADHLGGTLCHRLASTALPKAATLANVVKQWRQYVPRDQYRYPIQARAILNG
jgi:uracil-DNA glycosylase